jgi:hypothetical protein
MSKRHDPSCAVWTGRRDCDCVTSATRPGALVRTRRPVLVQCGPVNEIIRLGAPGVLLGVEADGRASVEFSHIGSELILGPVAFSDLCKA